VRNAARNAVRNTKRVRVMERLPRAITAAGPYRRHSEVEVLTSPQHPRPAHEDAATMRITRLLVAWGQGDQAALDELAPPIEHELHREAVYQMAGEAEPPPTTSDPALSWCGRRIAHYDVLAHIGAGGTGDVYLVESWIMGWRACCRRTSEQARSWSIPADSWERRATCRPSRRAASAWARRPTSLHWGSSCTRWRRDGIPSPRSRCWAHCTPLSRRQQSRPRGEIPLCLHQSIA
jgi:hypothetical protein